MTEGKDEIVNSFPQGPNTSPILPSLDLLSELAFDFSAAVFLWPQTFRKERAGNW